MRFRYILGVLFCLGLIAWSVAAQETDDTSDISLPITGDVTYTVRPGDTLDTIGARFDVYPPCIAETNNIEPPRRLDVGQTLQISVSCPRYAFPSDETPLQVPVEREVVRFDDECDGYRVRPGDALDTIAQQVDVSVAALREANDLNNSLLSTGECLTVPEDAPPYGTISGAPAAQRTTDTTAGQGGGNIPGEGYTVQYGDTLDSIAQAFDVSLSAIIEANNIQNPRTLQAGTTITIPDNAPPYNEVPALREPIEGELYTVEPGENLDELAQRFDVALRALEAANDVNPGRNVLPGTVIRIPVNVPAYGEDEQFDPSQLEQDAINAAGDGYVIQPRDTLDTIAAFYNVDTQCLAETNNIENPRGLRPGTTLIIDETCPPYTGFNNSFRDQDSTGGELNSSADADTEVDTSDSDS